MNTDHRPTDTLRPHPNSDAVPGMSAQEYETFVADITARGIQTPLKITTDGIVLDGHQRLKAANELAIATLPVTIVDPPDQLEYMLLAALRRRQLTASQRAALIVELDQLTARREQAQARSQANLRRGTKAPEEATLPPRQGKTRDHAATLARVCPRIVQDALTVKSADPDLFQRVKNGEIAAHLAARRVRRSQRDQAMPAAPLLPEGPFEVIYADPPWKLGNPDGPHAPENHYPTLTLDELKALKPPAAEQALLYLWAVNCLLPDALELMAAWGFTYKTNLVWIKPSIGLGRWTRNRHELLLLGRKGNYPCPDPEDLPDSAIEALRGGHSEKPDCVYALIEKAHPTASKLEMFARGPARRGWVVWGNEADPGSEAES